ncbi:ikaros family zinc finger protein-like isoform X1 [Haliotis rufescens]|uniref:ikaros family zinc finger protein-like isoform X1 n=1 Tax=Haliotis rufescens TaxID=6454 RepID=UPI00201EC955|nr:ikaros family zinc finger protein-like isoform X1 [Haliotis rufescens]
MAEDQPHPPSNEAKCNPGQGAVARLLLASSMIAQEEARRDGGNTHDKPMEVSDHRPARLDCHMLDNNSAADGTPPPDDLSVGQNDLSPDVYITYPPSSSGLNPSGRLYNCRFCNFSTVTYSHLQLHMPKHGGLKALKCPMCDYSTNDKSNFRRHKRLHMRNNPATVLRCGKCDFSTVLPRKIREHYSQDHGEDYGPPLQPMQEATALRIQTYGDNHFGGRHMEIPHNQCTQTAMPVGTIHTLLGAAPPSMQFARAEPQILTNCVTQYRPYEVPTQRVAQENHMASDYLRSIVSNIITTHHTPRVPATSTITSSSFYLPPPVESSQGLSPLNHPLTRQQQGESSEEEVKVKVEPVDCDGASDVSSSATPVRSNAPRHMEAQTTQRLSMEMFEPAPAGDRNNEATPSGEHGINNVKSTEAVRPQNVVRSTIESHDIRPSVVPRDIRSMVDIHENRPIADTREIHTVFDSRDVRSAMEARDIRQVIDPRDVRGGVDVHFTNRHIKTEMSNIGIQCTMPAIKTESAAVSNDNYDRRRTRMFLVERSVQCELLSSVRRISSTRLVSDTNEGDQPLLRPGSKCTHCGVTFEDEVLFSIHIGCHSHTDPFVCNVCGKQCYNKYGFYSHIMRGHQL